MVRTVVRNDSVQPCDEAQIDLRISWARGARRMPEIVGESP